MEALERYLSPRATCLDVGTGSGILAIAAAKLGARKVVGCDIDPIAVEIAASNGAQNGCDTKVRWVLGDVEKTRPFQPGCLVANLTVELIEEEFWKLERRVKSGAFYDSFWPAEQPSQADRTLAAAEFPSPASTIDKG